MQVGQKGLAPMLGCPFEGALGRLLTWVLRTPCQNRDSGRASCCPARCSFTVQQCSEKANCFSRSCKTRADAALPSEMALAVEVTSVVAADSAEPS